MWDEYGKNIEESRKKFQGYQGGLGGADMSGYTKTAAAASAMASSLQESWSQIVGDGGKKAKEMNTIWQMHAQEILNNEDVARRFYERYKDVIESVEDLNPALRKAIQNWWDLDRAEEAAYVRGAVSDQAAKMSEFMTAQDDKSFEKSVTNLEKYQDMVDDVTAQSKDRWRELQSFRWEEEGKTLRGLRSGWEKLAVDYAQQLRKMEQSRKDMTPDQSKELDQRIADYRVATQRMLDITRRMDLERAASALGVNKLIINSMDAMSEAVITRIVAIAESAYMVKLRLSELSKGFRTLGEAFDTKGWISGIADLLDWLVKAIDIANQMKIAMTAIREAFRTRIDIQWQNIGGMMVPLIDIQKINWTQLASGMISLFQAVAQGILLLDQILQSTSNWKRILGAAMVGGQIGAAIGSIWGPVGEAIGKIGGTAVGALIGWFKKPEYQRIMEEIGNSWGVAISEGTAKKIEETMKSRFGHMKNNRFYAEVLHLGDIIADAGGITEKNAKMFSDRMLWSFDHMASGIFTVTEGLQVFTDGLKEFAKYADAAGIDLAKLMRPQIDRFEQMVRSGFISVKEARGWYDENFSLFAENLEKTGSIASNEMIRLIRLNGELGLQSKAVADYIEVQMTRANEAWATLVDTIMAGVPETGLQGEDLSNTLDQLNRMGVLILATFNAAVAAGTPWLTALAGIGGSLDKLIEGYQRLNGSIDDAALNQLIWYRNFMKANEALFSGIEALNAGSIALANMGGVTAEVFQALQDQGLSMYADLLAAAEAAGGGQVDALRPIIPWLQTLQQMAREYGFELDETTQALIDLAMEHGLLKDEPVTVLGVLRDGFDRLIERLDLLLTRVYGLGGAIANLPSNKTITIDLDVPEVPDFTNPKPPTYTPEPMASGGVVRRPTVILAGEAGPEAIVPLDEARVGGVTVNFYLSTPDAATLKDFVSREVTPRLIDTLRRNEQGTLTSIRNVLGVT